MSNFGDIVVGDIVFVKGDANCQYVEALLDPSLGRVMVPVANQIIVVAGIPLVLGPFASRVLLQAQVPSVTLPAVSAWMTAQGPNGLVQNVAGWDRSIWDKGSWRVGQRSEPNHDHCQRQRSDRWRSRVADGEPQTAYPALSADRPQRLVGRMIREERANDRRPRQHDHGDLALRV
jgi:hypothetical protein